MSNRICRTVFTLLALLQVVALYAGGKEIRYNGIIIGYRDSQHKGRVCSFYAKNNTSEDVSLWFVNEYDNVTRTPVLLKRGERLSGSSIDLTFNALEIQMPGERRTREIYRCSSPLSDTKTEPKIDNDPEEKVSPILNDTITEKEKGKVIDAFNKYLEGKVPYYATSTMSDDSIAIQDYIDNLEHRSDRNDYIQNKGLHKLVKQMGDSLAYYEQNDSTLIAAFFREYKNVQKSDKPVYTDSMKVILQERRSIRGLHLQHLQQALEEASAIVEEETMTTKIDKKTAGVYIGIFLLLVALIIWYRRVRRRQKTATGPVSRVSYDSNGDAGIVVRNTTSTVLRKQTLDDVIGNNDYLKISCSEFCADSAVRYMYLKNDCIRDIYNMYAEDLRNPDNPKEDGCMVLGRWVHDEKTGQYDVSLEHIVLPGDDAVFAEYELNFGGKIKLKMSEKLRKLRRETNLQYDLTCWVHSHPGLGVFFSNSDNNVHMQLKNPLHPNFLTAIVVDILTPDQDFGIFTFRSDSTLNSKSDLTKMYSLEVMYKWAVGCLRTSFRAEDHFNTLAQVKTPIAECHAIQLSNSSIIDMGLLTAEPGNGLVALVHGFLQQSDDKAVYVVAKVDKSEIVPDNELIGCFVVAAHCSIPSIRKAIASYLDKVHFVLVYTASDGLLTSIPVVNRDLCNSEDCYGEQKLEDLKIWTRRKR